MSNQLSILPAIVILVLHAESNAQGYSAGTDSLLKEGRTLFALSIEDKRQIQPAMSVFQEILKEVEELQPRALAYLGALYTIKAKHTFFPFNKLKWAKKGLSVMDDALSRAPDDIEVLFVHGTICHNLPGLFNRQDDARRDFDKIIELLPLHAQRYDADFVADVLAFLNSQLILNNEELNTISRINRSLSIEQEMMSK